MYNNQENKYTVAWFKLSEFIIKREKERALGLYRLLFHSFKDKALAYKLEGDILFAFSDNKSIGSYQKAASLFEGNNKYLEAALIYEQLLSIDDTEVLGYTYKIFKLYSKINNNYKAQLSAFKLINFYVKGQDFMSLDSLLDNISIINDKGNDEGHKFTVELYEYLVNQLILSFSKINHEVNNNIFNTINIKIEQYIRVLIKYYIDLNQLHKIKELKSKVLKYSESISRSIDIFVENIFDEG